MPVISMKLIAARIIGKDLPVAALDSGQSTKHFGTVVPIRNLPTIFLQAFFLRPFAKNSRRESRQMNEISRLSIGPHIA